MDQGAIRLVTHSRMFAEELSSDRLRLWMMQAGWLPQQNTFFSRTGEGARGHECMDRQPPAEGGEARKM